MTNVLVTGGAGFIGSNFVRYAPRMHSEWHVTTLDKLTYCGRLENLQDVMHSPRHTFVKGDIRDAAISVPLVRASEIVVHFAAETHVDRSLQNADEFILTDVIGTFVLLEASRQATGLRRFIQISTDEVYGSGPTGESGETEELRPGNPYSASKAGADRLGHDRRYALDTTKLRTLDWAPRGPFADGLAATVEWYRANPWWWGPIKHQNRAFQAYYQAQYTGRGSV